MFARLKRKLLLFLAVLGPSTIATMAGNDAAGVITYSLSGANLGYGILFILPLLTILYSITQEIGSRIAVVTGKGLGDLIRERFGVRTALLVFSLLMIANFGSILTNVSALKATSILLGVHPSIFVFGAITCAFLLVVFTDYQKSQKIFFAGILLYFCYIFAAIKGAPHWNEAMSSLVIPPRSFFSTHYLLIAIAVVGTTITPWGQFFVQSYMKDKNLSTDILPYARVEAFFGASISNIFSFFIIVATAATLFVHGIPLLSGEQAAIAIRPFAGEFSAVLFSFGLLNAAIIGMIIISLSSAYVFSEFFGFEGTLDAPYTKSRTFYTIFLLNLLVAGVLVMSPKVSLFKIVLYTQSLNALLLPVVFYFLLKITNDRELMGRHVNSKWYNGIVTLASIFIILAAVVATITSFIQV